MTLSFLRAASRLTCSMLYAPLLLPLASNALTEGDYTYTVANGQATITAFNMSYSGPLSITNTLGGYPVTSIQGAGFGHCEGLTVVTIPKGVTHIGSYAFSGCGRMTRVTIPDSVISIGSCAFQYCLKLTSITIPGSVTSIGGSVFSQCRGLTAIVVDPANAVYASSNGVLINKITSTLISCPEGKTGAYTIPDSVTSIADGAFQSCYALTSVVIPGSIPSIGYYAFLHCTGLKRLVIGSGVSSISEDAFNDCIGLTSFTIPASVTAICDSAFAGCSGLTSVLFEGTPPSLRGFNSFSSTPATLYYLPTFASNWPATFGGRPTLCWNPTVQAGASFGFTATGFGFNIAGTPDIPVVVEATTNLASGVWTPLTNTTLSASGSLLFSDPASSLCPARFYRIVWP